MATYQTVVVTWDPTRIAYLIADGLEVSIIRWADSRSEQAIQNKYLRKRIVRKRLAEPTTR